MVRRLVSCVLSLQPGGRRRDRAARPTASGRWHEPSSRVDSPTVTPATGGSGVPSMLGMFTNVGAIGYQTSEYFVAGNAHSYGTGAPLTPDGRWNAITADPTTAPYATRVLVMTPANAEDFNGTVYVEWLNVSGGLDASPDWTHGHLQMAREGAAYVGVSAQLVGVNQLKSATGPPVPGDPARYAPLSHPGDSYSFDIFSQAGQAILDGKLLGELRPRRLHRGGRVAVSRPARHVHQRGAPARRRVRRLPRAQSRAGAAPRSGRTRFPRSRHPCRPRSASTSRRRCSCSRTRPTSRAACSRRASARAGTGATGSGRSPAPRTSTPTACRSVRPTSATARARSRRSSTCRTRSRARSRGSSNAPSR